MKYLITGSTGHLGSVTVDFLLKKEKSDSIIVLARNEEKAKSLKEKGVEVRIGNYDNYNSLVKAFQGIDKLLLISSSELTNRAAQHINAINASKEAGVKHIIYTSFIRQKDDTNSALWFIAKDHVETENHLMNCGIPYTIFKNGFYMDMITDFIGKNVLETQTIFLPAGEGKVSFALRNEIAEALANALTTDGHQNKIYNIGVEETVSFGEIANILSEISGKNIKYISPAVETYKQELGKHNVPEMYINMFAAFAVAFSENTMNVPSKDLTIFLNRKATSVKSYLTEIFSIVNKNV
jgi:NAD(P)H dehydrogenase (quinone)